MLRRNMNNYQKKIMMLIFFVSGAFFISSCFLPPNISPTVEVTATCSLMTYSTPALQTEIEVSRQNILDELPQRTKMFQDTLEIQLQSNNVNNILKQNSDVVSTFFNIYVFFKNTSDSKIVIRLPQNQGFINEPGVSEGGIYDLTIHVKDKDGNRVGALNSFYLLDDEKVKLQDFIVIDIGKSVCLDLSLELPQFFINNQGYAALPPDEYSMFITYKNFMTGYYMPLRETVPPDLSFKEGRKWLLSHQNVMDLGAWVGEISSNEVFFVISE
jgi:hypothetical protein